MSMNEDLTMVALAKAAQASSAAGSASAAAASAEAAAESAEEAAGYAADAFSGTPEGYEELVGDVGDLKTASTQHGTAIETLETDVVGKAAAIVVESDEGYRHIENRPIKKITFGESPYNNTLTAKYATSKNLFEYPNNATITTGGTLSLFTPRKPNPVWKIKGTITGTGTLTVGDSNADHIAAIEGKSVYLCSYFYKQNGWTGWSSSWNLLVYDNDQSKWVTYGTKWTAPDGWKVSGPYTMPSNIGYTIRFVLIDSPQGLTFDEGDYFWVGLYETPPIDTNEVVDGTLELPLSGALPEVVDTILHPSTVESIADTKTYVDEHTPDIIGYWSDKVYLLPEYFGAKGDGTTDDSQAFADCMAAARTYNKAVRGYGRYKTTQTIEINNRYADVYIREINYTGNGRAVSINHMDVKFEFQNITSAGDGIIFYKNITDSRYAMHCQVKGNVLSCTGNCIICNGKTYYNTVDIRYLSSTDSDLIVNQIEDNTGGGEYVFMNSTCDCPNGCVSRVGGRFYNFTIEGDCKEGLRNYSTAYGCRHREQIDGMKYRLFNPEMQRNNGPFLWLYGDGIYTGKYISNDSIMWFNVVPTADKDDYSHITPAQGAISKWQKLAYTGIDLGFTVRGTDSHSYMPIGEKTYLIGGHLVLEPGGRLIRNLEQAEYDMTLFDSRVDADILNAERYNWAWATDWITEYSHTDLYLNASYGAIGYNDLTLTQKDGNTCTIYDKLGDVLFDGTNEGDGVWSFKCSVDRNSFGRYDGINSWWCYDGTNEKWTITKIS